MIPVKCGVCQKHVMVWDTVEMQCEKWEGEFRKEHRVLYATDICKRCLPKDRMDCRGIVPDRNAKPSRSDKLDLRFNPLAVDDEEWVPIRRAPGVIGLKDQSFSAPEDGSQQRFEDRKRDVPWFTHTAWWLVHNCVAHMLIGFLPFGPLFKFHDWTSKKMHGK